MHSLRSILVHVDPTARAETRLRLACKLAARHQGGHVTGLYGTIPILLDIPFALAASSLTSLAEFDAQWRRDARARFEHATAGARNPVQWSELGDEALYRGFVSRAYCCDLLVLGQFDGGDPEALGVPTDFAASMLVTSGKPGLVVPYAGECEDVGTNVVIAWKPSREAARALACAMPLLLDAHHIHIAGASDDAAAGLDAVEAYLRLHGVTAELHRSPAVDSDHAGEALLSLAADTGADLLVMGCYGHSRARELVLGGASRTVLKCMTLPVLMAH